MANFDRLAELGKALFLQHDQKAILQRLHLESDPERIYVPFCGERFSVNRETGDVLDSYGTPAGPAETLTIFDMLCFTQREVRLSGEWRTTGMLPGSGQSSPDDVLLNSRLTRQFEEHMAALEDACRSIGGMPFPVGDVAWEIPVFPWFPAVFQFWLGDDEFPSSARLLWDRDALQYFHFETLFYIMGHVFRKLDAMIEERIKNP